MDWSRRPYTTTARLHASEDAPLVTIRWYFTDLPFQDHESIINSRDLDEEPWRPQLLGEQYGYARPFDPAPSPLGLTGQHQCGELSDFTDGQPWPYTGPPVVYGEDDIPLCCRPPVPCKTQSCGQELVNDAPASQFYQFAIEAANADGATPALAQFVADNLTGADPAEHGAAYYWLPAGRDGDPAWIDQFSVDSAGLPARRYELLQFTADEYSEREELPGVVHQRVADGGDVGTLTQRVVGGVGQLTGSNIQVDPAILPDIRPPWVAGATVTATGSTQSDAAPVVDDSVVLLGGDGTKGCTLPALAATGVPTLIVCSVSSSSGTIKMYPGVGGAFFPFVAGGPPINLLSNRTYVFQRASTNRWLVLYNQPSS